MTAEGKPYSASIRELASLVERPETRDEAMAAVRSLIEAVALTPEGGELRIDLQGDLAAILALGGVDAKKPAAGASGDGLVEQVKLVAGAGFAEDPTREELAITC